MIYHIHRQLPLAILLTHKIENSSWMHGYPNNKQTTYHLAPSKRFHQTQRGGLDSRLETGDPFIHRWESTIYLCYIILLYLKNGRCSAITSLFISAYRLCGERLQFCTFYFLIYTILRVSIKTFNKNATGGDLFCLSRRS